MPVGDGKLRSAVEAALLAKWTIIWTVIVDKLSEAFIAGAFATPQTTMAYFHDNWWMILVSGIMAALMGGYVRGQQKSNYIGRVESGTASPPSTPVIVPQSATVVTPEPPAQGDGK